MYTVAWGLFDWDDEGVDRHHGPIIEKSQSQEFRDLKEAVILFLRREGDPAWDWVRLELDATR